MTRGDTNAGPAQTNARGGRSRVRVQRAACSDAVSQAYPYGSAYEPSACNTADIYIDGGTLAGAVPALAAVGSFSRCVGAYTGLYDLSGNAWEWIDSCDADAGAAAHCRISGGSYSWGRPYDACASPDDSTTELRRLQAFPDLGFRCCGP
jgi:sulfatase modifying factor 1